MKVIVFITYLFIMLINSSYADEESLIYESLDFEVRYFNAISKSAVILQEYFNKYPESEHEKIIKTDTFINNVLRKELYEIADVYAEQYSLTASKKLWFISHLKRINPKNIVNSTVHLIKNNDYYLRKYGIGMGLALSSGFLLELTVPVLLVKTGFAYLIPASMTVPYAVILASFVRPYDVLTKWKKEKNALGMNYSEYVRMRRQIKNRLKTISDFDLLIPIRVKGVTSEKLLTIQQTKMVDKVLRLFNIERKRSNYITISRFIKRHHLQDKYTKWIAYQRGLKAEEKTVLLVHHLFESGDEKVQANFITEFSSFFSHRPKLPRTHRLKAWTKRLLAAKTSDEVAQVMSLVPPGTPPVVIIQVWEDLAIPQLIKNIPMKVGALRKLKKELELLRAISSTKAHRERLGILPLRSYLGKKSVRLLLDITSFVIKVIKIFSTFYSTILYKKNCFFYKEE